MTEQAQISPNGSGILPPGPPQPERVVSVEIDELVFDGFGPLDSRVNSRRPNSRHPAPGGPDVARAAEVFRRELVRELADVMTGAAAEQLAGTIADAVFRQLAAVQQRRGPRPMGGAR